MRVRTVCNTPVGTNCLPPGVDFECNDDDARIYRDGGFVEFVPSQKAVNSLDEIRTRIAELEEIVQLQGNLLSKIQDKLSVKPETRRK